MIHSLPNGDFFERTKASLILHFAGSRKVLSTSPLNGGYREDLTHVFNHDCLYGTDGYIRMKGDTYREHMLNTVKEIGLDPGTCAGLETAAQMRNASIKSMSGGGVTVTAVTTAGVQFNAARAGDEASWEENSDVARPHPAGTINTILCISSDMSEGAMAGAMVTCTEAKTVALQELVIPSCYSPGLATGTGTDGIIVVADAGSPKYLTDAGKHTRLGEMIGKCVIASIKEAIDKQTGWNASYMHDAVIRTQRFGVDAADIPSDVRYKKKYVVAAGLIAHLLDELNWGLIDEEEADFGARWVLEGCNGMPPYDDVSSSGADETRKKILDSWKDFCKNNYCLNNNMEDLT